MKRIKHASNDTHAMRASVAILGLLVGGVVGFGVWNWSHTETHQACIVEDKDRTTQSSGGSSDARVYTTCGVFKVGDDMFRGKYTSADTYANIKVGETYDFTTSGMRFGPLSIFPNIIEVEEA